jgi:hypothetical protein
VAGIFGGFQPDNTLGSLFLTPPKGNEAYWRQRLANQGSISKARPSLAGRLENATASTLRKAGVSNHNASRIGSKAFAAINDLTPVGNATMAADAGAALRGGDWLGGIGLGALAVLPSGVGKAGKGMFGARVFHASPQSGLDKVLAQPPARQYDNATSQFGAFFAPNAEGAQRYGPNLYSTDLTLNKPYEMDWSEFARFQAIEKGADGTRIPGELWEQRAKELQEEAIRFRQQLAEQGHDGIIIRGPRGDIKEIASFNDVPLR